jgi:hypothetical protein
LLILSEFQSYYHKLLKMRENKIVVDKFKTVDKIVKLTEQKRKILFVYDFLDMVDNQR